jgi:protoporphyrinogen oxidase
LSDILVLGTGMAALGASSRLLSEGLRPVLVDKNLYPGGHTATFASEDGFIFDDGPHISFTSDVRLQEMFAEQVDQEYEVLPAYVDNWYQGHWVRHPVQANLGQLPKELTLEILEDMILAMHRPEPEQLANYREWLYAAFGPKFAERFPMQYGRRYHTTEAANMSLDWLGPRLYRPNLRELLKGAIIGEQDVHYVSNFRYPKRGGFISYLNRMLAASDVRLGHQAVGIDSRTRHASFSNGASLAYDRLISTMPLPELVKILDDVPAPVREAAAQLACSSCVVVNIGIDRPEISPAHWRYFYDDDFIFCRLSFPHLLSGSTVPAGYASVQAEVYWSKKYKPLELTTDQIVERVISDLRRCGVLAEGARVVHQSVLKIAYANVIFDLERASAVRTVHEFLRERDIEWAGRFGDWDYSWTDQAFLSGERAAQRLLDARTVRT